MPVTRATLGSALIAALSLLGCGGSYHHGGGYYHGGGIPDQPSTPIYAIAPGYGIDGVQPGYDLGYFITANTGGSFRVVWSGDAAGGSGYRHFTGSVWTPGNFVNIDPGCVDGSCALESEDYVSSTPYIDSSGSRIDFDTLNGNGIDGIDFVVDALPVYFQLNVDGYSDPTLVFFPATDNGAAVSNVGDVPFGLTQ